MSQPYAGKIVDSVTSDTTAQEPYGYVYTVNVAYTMFSDKKPPDDAYDEGTLVAVAAIRGEEGKCTYPECKCPFDMPDTRCARGFPSPTMAFGPTMAERGEFP